MGDEDSCAHLVSLFRSLGSVLGSSLASVRTVARASTFEATELTISRAITVTAVFAHSIRSNPSVAVQPRAAATRIRGSPSAVAGPSALIRETASLALNCATATDSTSTAPSTASTEARISSIVISSPWS